MPTLCKLWAAGAPVGKRSLKVASQLGEDTGGGLTKWLAPAPQVFIRYTYWHEMSPALKEINGALIIADNFGLALDPSLSPPGFGIKAKHAGRQAGRVRLAMLPARQPWVLLGIGAWLPSGN